MSLPGGARLATIGLLLAAVISCSDDKPSPEEAMPTPPAETPAPNATAPSQSSLPTGCKGTVFVRQGPREETYILQYEGGQVKRLDKLAASSFGESLSPDGKRIAYNRVLVPNRSFAISVANLDGSNPTDLTAFSPSLDQLPPAWSLNGDLIAYAGSGKVWVISSSGASSSVEVSLGIGGEAPSWSPDGTRLVFTGREPGSYTTGVYVVDADGSGLRRLSPAGSDDIRASWSPDGGLIAFVTQVNQDRFTIEINVMTPDGSGRRSLAKHDATGDDLGAPPLPWSPDGKMLAILTNRDGGGPELYVVNADGSGLKRVTDSPEHEFEPEWSQDGACLTFYHDTYLEMALYVVGRDGAGVTKLLTLER